MTKTNKKFMALAAAAVLGTAGAAWAIAGNQTLNQINSLATVADYLVSGNIQLMEAGEVTLLGNVAIVNAQASLSSDATARRIVPAVAATQTTTFAPAASRDMRDGATTLGFDFGGEGTLAFKGANNGNPNDTTYNNFSGGVVVTQGTLRLTDYNSIGYSPISIDTNYGGTSTKFGTAKVEIRERDVDLGNRSPHVADNNSSILASQNVVFNLFTDGDATTYGESPALDQLASHDAGSTCCVPQSVGAA